MRFVYQEQGKLKILSKTPTLAEKAIIQDVL